MVSNGTLQWSTHGVYTFRVLDNKYTIVHCDGTEAAWPEDGANLSKCLPTDNHSDILGVVRIGAMTPTKLKALFPKNVGPNTPKVVNHKSATTNQLALEADLVHSQRAAAAKAEKRQAAAVKDAVDINEAARKKTAMAKRKPSTPPTKRHRCLLGTILTPTPTKASVPIADEVNMKGALIDE